MGLKAEHQGATRSIPGTDRGVKGKISGLTELPLPTHVVKLSLLRSNNNNESTIF